jgi:hypothetical protein
MPLCCVTIASVVPLHCLFPDPLPHNCLTIVIAASPLPLYCLSTASLLPLHCHSLYCLYIASLLPLYCLSIASLLEFPRKSIGHLSAHSRKCEFTVSWPHRLLLPLIISSYCTPPPLHSLVLSVSFLVFCSLHHPVLTVSSSWPLALAQPRCPLTVCSSRPPLHCLLLKVSFSPQLAFILAPSSPLPPPRGHREARSKNQTKTT